MTEFQNKLKELGFNFLDNASDDAFIKQINIGFVSLNECYSYDKQTGEPVWENMGIGVNSDLLDELANPDGKQDQETTRQAAIKHFSKFGNLDLSSIDEGNIHLEPNDKRPLINHSDFVNAVNGFIQDTKEIFE